MDEMVQSWGYLASSYLTDALWYLVLIIQFCHILPLLYRDYVLFSSCIIIGNWAGSLSNKQLKFKT